MFLGAWRTTLKWDEFMKMCKGLKQIYVNPVSPMATEKEKETCEYAKHRQRTMLDFWNRLNGCFAWPNTQKVKVKAGLAAQRHFEEWNRSAFYLGIFQWCNLFALHLGLFVKDAIFESETCHYDYRSKSFHVCWLWLVRRINNSRTLSGNWEFHKHDITWKPWPANMYAVYLSVLFVSPDHTINRNLCKSPSRMADEFAHASIMEHVILGRVWPLLWTRRAQTFGTWAFSFQTPKQDLFWILNV